MVFIVFKHTFDTVKQEKMYKAMKELEIPKKYINRVRIIF